MMDLNLTDRVAVVFGGVNGIGRGIAAAFAAEGARVAVVDRVKFDFSPSPRGRGGRGEGLLSEPNPPGPPSLGGKGGDRVTGFIADATDPAAVRAALDTITEQLGPVEHVVFAVGCGSGHFGFPFWNVPVETWDRVLRVNLIAAAVVAHAVAPIFTAQRRGTLLFLSSVAAQVGSPTDPPYSAAKAGLLNFMEVCAKDFAPFGVRVNAVCPGMIRTDLNRGVWQAWADRQPPEAYQTYEQWTEEKIRRTVPLGRWQTVEDVAAAAVFLASDRAGNVTGQTINVDGGQVMHW